MSTEATGPDGRSFKAPQEGIDPFADALAYQMGVNPSELVGISTQNSGPSPTNGDIDWTSTGYAVEQAQPSSEFVIGGGSPTQARQLELVAGTPSEPYHSHEEDGDYAWPTAEETGSTGDDEQAPNPVADNEAPTAVLPVVTTPTPTTPDASGTTDPWKEVIGDDGIIRSPKKGSAQSANQAGVAPNDPWSQVFNPDGTVRSPKDIQSSVQKKPYLAQGAGIGWSANPEGEPPVEPDTSGEKISRLKGIVKKIGKIAADTPARYAESKDKDPIGLKTEATINQAKFNGMLQTNGEKAGKGAAWMRKGKTKVIMKAFASGKNDRDKIVFGAPSMDKIDSAIKSELKAARSIDSATARTVEQQAASLRTRYENRLTELEELQATTRNSKVMKKIDKQKLAEDIAAKQASLKELRKKIADLV